MTADRLASLGRDVPASFAIRALLNDEAVDLHVAEIRRLLPGRRIAAAADFGDKRAFVKLFCGPQARRDATREADGHRLLHDAGIAVAELLGRGRIDGGGEVVAYGLLQDCVPISADALPRAMWTLARMHNAGIVHADLHADNLLVSADRIHVVDGGAVTARGAPFTEEGRVKDIASLLAQFASSGRAQIDNVINAYAEAAPRIDTRRWRVRLQAAFAAALRARVRRYVHKSMRDCSEFRVEQNLRRFTVCVRTEFPRLAAVIDDPDGFVARGRTLKDGGTATVVRAQAEPLMIVIKRYNMKSVGHRLSRGLRASRASRAWRNGHRLRMLGIATADPLLLVEERFGPIRGRAFLVMRSLDGPTLADVDPRAHLDRIVAMFGALRDAGLVHGDTKASNFVLDGEALALVDLDSMYEANDARLQRGHADDIARFLANWNDAPDVRAQLAVALNTVGAPAFV